MKLFNGDCLEIMKNMPDKSVDAVVTDPPYGMKSHNMRAAIGFMNNDWDEKPADKNQIDETIRVSKNQVIFGGNYFHLPPSRCWLVWDKNFPTGLSFADCELAWTSFDEVVRKFEYRPMNIDGGKVHPTQKPLSLMKWVILNYTNEGDAILDPFMGSGTTGVACVQTGRDFIGIELDPDYFAIAEKRIHEAMMQPRLI